MRVSTLALTLSLLLLQGITAELEEMLGLQESRNLAKTEDFARELQEDGSAQSTNSTEGEVEGETPGEEYYDDDEDDDEYDDDDDDDDDEVGFETCDMECDNGGKCMLLELRHQHAHVMTQRCVCPAGYGGILCEIKVDVCFSAGDKEVFCQNESPCRIMNGRAMCNCKEAYDVSAFAGLDCAHPATEYCTESGHKSFHAFCTNGGECKTYVGVRDEHPGCDCLDGYEGDHCEYQEGEEKMIVQGTESSSSGSSTAHNFFIAFLVIVYVGSLAVLIVLVRRWRIRTQAEREIVQQANLVTSELTMRHMNQQQFSDTDTIPLAPGQESKELNENMSDLIL